MAIDKQFTARVIGMLCMGMTLAVATAIMTLANWILDGADPTALRTLAVQPMAMFAVGVGVRFIGTTLMRNPQHLWRIVLGDIVAAFIGVLVFSLVAALNDPAKIVLVAGTILTVTVIPVAAVASLAATGISRSRRLSIAFTCASIFILLASVALQGMIYWPSVIQ